MEKKSKRAHYIMNGKDIILYLPDSIRFFKINEKTKQVLEDICNGINKGEILDKHKIDSSLYSKLYDLVTEQREITDTPSDVLIKLTLIVSNTCNLSCKYCYADGGKYRNCTHDMNPDTVKKTIDTFFNKYKLIQNIMFFGGEPTLNIDVIERACEYIYYKYNNGEIKYLPNLGMITNGTIITEKLIKLINKYSLNITISLDGSQELNDQTRLYKNGKGTYEDIVKNIEILQKRCNQPGTIEATYSRVHKEADNSVMDVVKFCKDNFGVERVHIAPVSNIKLTEYYLENKQSFLDSIDEVFEYKRKGKDYSYTSFNVVLEGLKYKNVKSHYCEAGLARFAVSVEGDVYPCYLFTGEKEMCLGNVHDKNLFESEKFIKITDKLRNFNKFQVEKCEKCFNNTLCRQCIAENYFTNQELQHVPEETCEYSKKRVELMIKNLVG